MRTSIAATLLVVLTACVQTKAAVLDVSAQRAPICPNGVKIYPDTSNIGQPWEPVAILTSSGETNAASVAGMLNSQRKKAAQVGANGVLLGQVDEARTSEKVVGAIFGSGSQRRGNATAIYVPGDTARVSSACIGDKNRMEAVQ